MMNNETVDRGNLRSVLGEVLGSVPITDIHTHIYPAEFKQLSLWGIDELLTYHYLVAEFFRFSDMPYDDFFALPKERQAELVWTTLFIDNSPVSEAARGVLTILSRLGLDVASRDLQSYRAYFASLDHKDYIGKVLDIAGVSEIVMTNDPFDPVEHEFWTTIGNPDPRFKGVLRLDPLLNDYGNSWRKLVEWGYAVEATMNAGSVAEIRRFLRDWVGKLDALYLAASLPPEFAFPEDSLRGKCLRDCVLPVCQELGKPFALMVGARPAVNPKLRVAGSSVGLVLGRGWGMKAWCSQGTPVRGSVPEMSTRSPMESSRNMLRSTMSPCRGLTDMHHLLMSLNGRLRDIEPGSMLLKEHGLRHAGRGGRRAGYSKKSSSISTTLTVRRTWTPTS